MKLQLFVKKALQTPLVTGDCFYVPAYVYQLNIFQPLINGMFNFTYNKQLFDEVEHDIKNYSDRGQC